jgi:ribosomal-protein-alanine N-acetyltransferase
MQVADLEAVLAIESCAYSVPWTHGNFIDSLAAGYLAQVLCCDDGRVLGYFLAMQGAGELHLLNIAVAPQYQGQGHALSLLDALLVLCRGMGFGQIWLEVRQSNERARRIYRRYGFTEVGQRRAYYPCADGTREDAVLMSMNLHQDAQT